MYRRYRRGSDLVYTDELDWVISTTREGGKEGRREGRWSDEWEWQRKTLDAKVSRRPGDVS